MIYLNHVLMIF